MGKGKNEEKLYEGGKTPTEEDLEIARKKDKEESEAVNIQTKVSIEVAISRNFNKVTFGIQDEPISSGTEEEFRKGLHKKAEILREESEKELKLIGTLPK